MYFAVKKTVYTLIVITVFSKMAHGGTSGNFENSKKGLRYL